jgi:hypothetical protein
VAQIRSISTFANQGQRLFFPINSQGILVGFPNSPVYTDPTIFNTTGRPWFLQGNGWTPQYTSFTGGLISSFAASFPPPPGGQTGVVAADRTLREPCNVCLQNSWAVPAATALAQNLRNPSSPVIGVTTLAGVNAVLMMMKGILLAGNRGYSSYLAVGLSDKTYYEIYDCSNPLPSDSPPGCSASFPYLVTIQNDAVALSPGGIGTVGSISSFSYSASGVLGSSALYVEAYDCTQRPWYQTGNGWSAPFNFVGTTYNNILGQSYSQPGYNLQTGQIVAVALAMYKNDHPCSGYITPTCSTGASPSPLGP